MNDFPFKETRYGFDWGPLKIERVFSRPVENLQSIQRSLF
jgi:hypothetical protein